MCETGDGVPCFPHGASELVRLQQTLYTSRNPTRRWLHTTRYDWIRRAIEHSAAPGKRALEVGPGSGVYLPLLARQFAEVVAVDIEAEYLEGALPFREQFDNISFMVDDITNSRLDTGSFDVILCSEVVEHLHDSPAALAEMHRVLKPGGILILSTPQPFSPLELAARIAFLPGIVQIVRRVYREPVLELGHCNLLSRHVLTIQLAHAGFKVREEFQSGVYLPLISEFGGTRALRAAQWLERVLRGSVLQFLLWTQYYVAEASESEEGMRRGNVQGDDGHA